MVVGQLASRWWALALRGAIAIAFGILAIFVPGLTIGALILLFGAYAVVGGVSSIAAGIRGAAGNHNWLLVLVGVAGAVAGLLALFWPGITALVLLAVIGSWAVATGVLEIAVAYRLRSQLHHEWLLAFDGALSIALGVFVFLFPGAGALALAWLIGAYAIASGVCLLVLAFRLRSYSVRSTATA